jgi:rhodanese-related sulfurtransferase
MITHRNRLALSHYAELARIGKVLASPVRLRLVDLLRQGARSVESLAAAAGLSVANASQHLQHMRRARVVEAERRGQFVEYRLADEAVSRSFAALRELAEALLPEMDRLRAELSVLEPGERDDLLQAIRRDEVTLVDVRPPEEYRAGHLPGAYSLPLEELRSVSPGELRSRLRELPRNRELVAYCRGPYCSLATTAVDILRRAGFAARHLDLGVPDLRARRFLVASVDAPVRHALAPERRSRGASPQKKRSTP